MKLANEALSFLLELAMLAAFAFYGLHLSGPSWLRWIVGIGLPVVVIIFWSIFMAPQASHRLAWPIVPIVALLLFLISSLLLYIAGGRTLALVMATVSIVSAILTLLWRQY